MVHDLFPWCSYKQGFGGHEMSLIQYWSASLCLFKDRGGSLASRYSTTNYVFMPKYKLTAQTTAFTLPHIHTNLNWEYNGQHSLDTEKKTGVY